MDIMEAIFTRRSIRSFTDADVSDEQIHQLLDAAMTAPSAGNAQPWEFIVIRDAAGKQAIADNNQYAAMAPKAPVCILVCADPSREKHPGYWPQDCAAAIQNMLLAARAQGLGTVWTGIYPDKSYEAFQKFFGLPAHVIPQAAVVIGYPDQPFKEKHRFDATRVRKEKW